MGRKRIWEIDLLRAAAIVLMTAFHTVYDLNVFLGMDIVWHRGFWFWVGKASALIFIFISGISSGLGSKTVKRGLLVLGLGLGISAVTYFVLGDEYLRFGILHFLGACMLLSPALRKLPAWGLALLALTVACLARTVEEMTVSTFLLLPLGFKYAGFSSADYYPLIPYLAVFTLGIIAYKLYYYQRRSLFNFQAQSSIIAFLSRNSLLIYVVHQPLILGLLLLCKRLT